MRTAAVHTRHQTLSDEYIADALYAILFLFRHAAVFAHALAGRGYIQTAKLYI